MGQWSRQHHNHVACRQYLTVTHNVPPTTSNKSILRSGQPIAMTNFRAGPMDTRVLEPIRNVNQTYVRPLPPPTLNCNNIESPINETPSVGLQHVINHDPTPHHETTHQILNCSPIDMTSASKVEHMSKLTKWLCAIILALVTVILVLILLDAPQKWNVFAQRTARQNNLFSSRSNRLFPTERSGNQNSVNPGEQGKLLASSSDDHFTTTQFGDQDTADQDFISEHDENQTDSSSDKGPDDKKTPDTNQVMKEVNRLHQSHRPNHKVHRDPSPDTVCMTPGCVRAAAQLIGNMDPNTKPCDDFYQFACGRWISTQVIPDEKTSLSVFSQTTADLNLKLRALIERQPRSEDPPIVEQMRNMYASCMNLTDIETRGNEPLEEVLRFLGGWPVLTHKTDEATPSPITPSPALTVTQRRRRNNGARRLVRATGDLDSRSNSREFDWLETLIKFRQRGFSHDMIIDLSVVPDVRNNKRYIIELDQSSLGLPDRAYYFKGMNDTTVGAYYNLMVDSAIMLGAPRAEARRQMLEVLEFETSLARISAPREQRRNVTRLYNKMQARDLYKLAPNIEWKRYLRSLLKDDQLDLDEDQVIVKVPSFLQSIDSLLTKTEPRIVANYMIWRIVRTSMHGLSKSWRELAHKYSTVTTGRQVEEPRWEQCLGSLDGTLGTALSAFYVKNHFNERSKAAALEMVDYIKEEILKILNEVDWMDEETREEARNKARAISAYIGYPDELLRDELVEELYKGIKMSRQNFYQNVRNLRIWSTDYAFGQLRKPNKRGDWKKHARAAVVNAFYNPLENSIEFPAGILQGAFFDAERPNYMNFGAIGYVIGHEITHGFDDRGRQFDRDGNERNWWKPKTDARFRERAQCIIEQYGNYTVAENGLKVNGFNTQGENIADNGGIKEAFRAYRRWTKDHHREPRLPGLSEYTPDQLFWVSAANIWCGKFRPEVLKLRVNSGVHSPARFRIVGPLSNSPEFAQSFGCPVGSAMNPQKKCSVW